MDKFHRRTVFRWLVGITVCSGLFAAMHYVLGSMVPATPMVQAMLFAGASIILTYMLMLEAVARYALAVLLTALSYFLVRYGVSHWLFGGAPLDTMMSTTVIVIHLFLLVALTSLLDESTLFGEQCPECQARGAVSQEVVDKYRHDPISRSGDETRRMRVTSRMHCRKCGHIWFERSFAFEE